MRSSVHEPNILVLSYAGDATADHVEAALRRRGARFVRYDTSWFPLRSSIAVSCGNGSASSRLRWDGADLDLGGITSVWYRHPQTFEPDPRASPSDRKFVTGESVQAVGGMLRSLRCRWMNHPSAMVEASYKVSQLTQARESGLSIPRTLVTNEPEAARHFVSSCDGAIIKVLGDQVVPAVNGPGSSGIIFTSDITLEHLAHADRVKLSPCLLQEKVHKRVELRIVAVDSQVFCAEIDSQAIPESSTDCRRRIRFLKHSAGSLPGSVQKALLRLIRSFGLRFGVVDMAITPDGEYVFFELNPNGQWLWLEDAAGLPIADAIADALVGDACGEDKSHGEA
jgi:glutathione synthase/RimK-type ligase-like ATP-grasp enzyme